MKSSHTPSRLCHSRCRVGRRARTSGAFHPVGKAIKTLTSISGEDVLLGFWASSFFMGYVRDIAEAG